MKTKAGSRRPSGASAFQLIEASAGTGKTYSITSQYLLLLLVEGLRVDQILVVTYTEAATAELKDRIRSRLRLVHDALSAGDHSGIDDESLREVSQRIVADPDAGTRAIRQLRSAIVSFDQASISTIHGFCNSVLAQQAFAAGGQAEVVTDDTPILESVVDDFVRLRLDLLTEAEYLAFVQHSPLVDGVGKGDWGVPGRLMLKGGLKSLAKILGTPFARVLPDLPEKVSVEEGAGQYALWMTRRLIDYAREELPRRKREAGIISYSDMLLGVWKALEADTGGRLTTELRSEYRAALIDEFQDTNPLQFEIFRKIFDGTGYPVMFVGDPKQAIFAFSGGDIFAYFDATREIPEQQRKTLGVNYRSSGPLVQAVSELFTYGRAEDIFRDGGRSAFPGVQAHDDRGKEPRDLWTRKDRGAMHWFLMPGSDQRKKGEARDLAVAITVREIGELLSETKKGEAAGNALQPGDIAVLVRTHADGALVQDGLRDAGIPSVVKARGDVFESAEAEELLLIIRAVADPRNESALASALLSTFVGFTADRLIRVREQSEAYEAIVGRYLDLQRLWVERGFIRMAMEMLHSRGFAADGRSVIEQIGRGVGSERSLTNLLHLFELLHQESMLHPGVRHLVHWMERRIVDDVEREAPLRLESDEERVQIVTIHSSKGLEYPVVFCPFVWEGGTFKNYEKSVVFCHDPSDRRDSGRTVLLADLGSADRANHFALAKREHVSENIRLLYVALTRARQRCYLVWGLANNMHEAALSWLLFPGFDGEKSFFSEMGYGEIVRPVVDLARNSSGGITWSEVEEHLPDIRPGAPEVLSPLELKARTFTARPPVPGWGFVSYTSLTKQWSRSPRDRDTGAEQVTRSSAQDLSIHSFPAGARTGIVWHELFEGLNFRAPGDEIRAHAVSATGRSGAPAVFVPAVEKMIGDALVRPVTPDGGRLCDQTEETRELEFTFRVPRYSTEAIRRVLQDPASGLDPRFGSAAGSLAYREVSGFMTGAIDLFFRWNGRFYLLDYKSNLLGSTSADYSDERLKEVIAREHYYLQYLIYAVAANRYLSLRLPGYSYDEHFGGVSYLFLRGMALFFDRPARSLIEALESALGEA